MNFREVPFLGSRAYRTPYGIILPPGGTVAAYVHSALPDGYPRAVSAKVVPSLSSALARVQSGLGDVVVLLPGHSESTDSATYLSELEDDTVIIGVGRGSSQPIIRLTDAAAQLAFDNDNVYVQNVHFQLDGANGITKAINVTGADVAFEWCRFYFGSGASNHPAIALEIGTGGDRCSVVGCEAYGAVAAAATNGFLVAAAVDGVRFIGNNIQVATTVAAVGPLNVNAAATNLIIYDNFIRNIAASSTAAITFADAACDGICAKNWLFAMGADATPDATIIVDGAANKMRFAENYGCSEDDLSGVLTPAAT